jgi:hypothetical protein
MKSSAPVAIMVAIGSVDAQLSPPFPSAPLRTYNGVSALNGFGLGRTMPYGGLGRTMSYGSLGSNYYSSLYSPTVANPSLFNMLAPAEPVLSDAMVGIKRSQQINEPYALATYADYLGHIGEDIPVQDDFATWLYAASKLKVLKNKQGKQKDYLESGELTAKDTHKHFLAVEAARHTANQHAMYAMSDATTTNYYAAMSGMLSKKAKYDLAKINLMEDPHDEKLQRKHLTTLLDYYPGVEKHLNPDGDHSKYDKFGYVSKAITARYSQQSADKAVAAYRANPTSELKYAAETAKLSAYAANAVKAIQYYKYEGNQLDPLDTGRLAKYKLLGSMSKVLEGHAKSAVDALNINKELGLPCDQNCRPTFDLDIMAIRALKKEDVGNKAIRKYLRLIHGEIRDID